MQAERKRGVFLIVWLVLMTIANAYISFMSLLLLIIDYWPGRFFHTYAGGYFTMSIIPVLSIVFCIATWKWKRWGIIGLGVTAIATACLMGLFSPILGVVIGGVEIIVLAMLVVPIWKHFEWR